MRKVAAPVLRCLGIVGAAVAASPIAAAAPSGRIELTPYIDVEQFTQQQLHGDGDSVTYTEISAGLTGEIRRRRLVASLAYRFDQRIRESGTLSNSQSHDGLARARATLFNDTLSIDAGAIATHTRDDPGGAAPQIDSGSAKNLTQVYSAYISPSWVRQFGEVGIAATYRYGYTTNQGTSPSPLPGEPKIERFESSMDHQADLTVGMKRSSLPFDWNITGDYQFENSQQLARHFQEASSSAQVIVPLVQAVALVASTGYELTKTSERKALTVAGIPVVTSKGGFVADPTSPRILTYDVEGLVANAGIIWAPSRHTRLELRVGYRYHGLSITGSLEMQPNLRDSLQVSITDQVQTFGQGVTNGLADTSTTFDASSVLTDSPMQNCVFGSNGGSTQCLGGTLGSASSSVYRSRGITISYAHTMRGSQLQLGLGYQRRNYIDDPNIIGSLNGVVDQSIFLQAGYTRQLARNSGLNFALSGNLFKNGQVGVPNVKSGAFDSTYYHTFGKGLRATATIGVEASKTDGVAADILARGQLGVRYDF